MTALYSDPRLESVDVPIVLLVGGATGTGKSTVATEVAHRLGITRVTSTDFIRQTLRAYFTPDFMPTVHASSFEAGETEAEMIPGFVEQTRNVLVGVEAAIDRAMLEGFPMVLEGVHLVPGMLPAAIEGALVVQVVLAVEPEAVHRANFHVRDTVTGGVRPMERYLSHIDDIRRLQDYIVGRARAEGVPVLESSSRGRATSALLELVFAAAAAG